MEAQVVPSMTEKEMIKMIVDTLPVFYYEKTVGYTPSSFAVLVFAGERIEVGMKRGKFDYPALMNEKAGANEENEKEGGTHVVTAIPTCPNLPLAPQYQYSANINPSHYPPPNQPQTIPKLAIEPTYRTSNTKHKPKNQSGKEFSSEKACRIHPNSGVLC